MPYERRYPIGAEAVEGGTTSFRVWAPRAKQVALQFENPNLETCSLQAEGNGYFSTNAVVPAGTMYRYRLDTRGPYPDPASRFQPDGVHGASQVIDPHSFEWTDQNWKGVSLTGQVLYEMHIGTFTPEGTWVAAERQLTELAACGITCLEVMPINEFPGRFGWGYDGVNLFAPFHHYGQPDDVRRFVNTAHSLGLGVILDVVYNHLGPDGNYLGEYAADYFTDRHQTDWGRAIDYDGPNSGPVREFFLSNTAYWIDEFHFDGLRLDATQNIYDQAAPSRHILTEIGRSVRTAARGRSVIVVNENECQHAELARPIEQGGYGLDAFWNDDYHHSASVALTGRREAYYADYRGDPQEFISTAKYGFLYQGQWYSWQKQRRGHAALNLPPAAFVHFLQNHDQIANSGFGLRIHHLTSPGKYRALHALTLLGPNTPMLFQGQEFESSSPFLFFADHGKELATLVQTGRRTFLEQFPSLKDEAVNSAIPAPHEEDVFLRCKLDYSERSKHRQSYALTCDLLALRKSDPAFQSQSLRSLDGAVLSPDAFVLRFFQPDGQDRLLLVNLGKQHDLQTCPEPLLAPPTACRWTVALSTEDLRYGGGGVCEPETSDRGWLLPAECAIVLKPVPVGPTPSRTAA